MNPITDILPWSDVLRGLRNATLAASLATFIVVPSATTVSVLVDQAATASQVEPVSAPSTGDAGLDLMYFSGPQSLVRPRQRDEAVNRSEELDVSSYLANELRDISGLSQDQLAQLAGVSRMTFHKWLKGEGISSDHVVRVSELIETFRTLRSILGGGVRDFIMRDTSIGKLVDLLLRGEPTAVIGLALLAPPNAPGPSLLSEEAHRISGVPGWLSAVSSLGWSSQQFSDAELLEAMDQMSPATRFSSAVELPIETDSDDEYIAYGYFFE